MTHPSGNLSNEQYINGLRSADPEVLTSIYVEFRTAVVRAITSLGGSETDGGIFFRAGLVEAARQAREGEFPEGEPFFFQIRELAVAHYRDWLAERLPAEARSAEAGAMPDPESPAPEAAADLPAEAEAAPDAPPSPEASASERSEPTSNFKLQTSNFQLVEGTQGQVWDLQVFDGQLFCGHNAGTFLIQNGVAQ